MKISLLPNWTGSPCLSGVTGMSGMDHDQMNMKIDLGDIAYPLHLVNGRTRQDPPTVTVPAGGC